MATVGIRELRDHLSQYMERVQDGEEIVVTEHGRPVARVVSAGPETTLDRLIREGRVTPAKSPKVPTEEPIKTAGSVSDLVSQQRR